MNGSVEAYLAAAPCKRRASGLAIISCRACFAPSGAVYPIRRVRRKAEVRLASSSWGRGLRYVTTAE